MPNRPLQTGAAGASVVVHPYDASSLRAASGRIDPSNFEPTP
jgi:hypothetical protein